MIEDEAVVVSDLKGNLLTVVGIEYDEDRHFLTTHLAESLKLNEEYFIQMGFVAILNDDLTGFYRSNYIDRETGNRKWMANTQFQLTSARQSFPCMDEPDRKARFTISISHSSDMIAVSNMPLDQRETIEDKDIVVSSFQESVKMSTYLVAFMVADFGSTVNETGVVPLTIYHQKNKAEQAKLAASIGPQILAFYQDYFDLAFPLPKMDMAAIPDFALGGMENWGLIMYRETLLLFDENISTEANKEAVTYVIAHELAHQWFGNIVTLDWWTDLWLNEGKM